MLTSIQMRIGVQSTSKFLDLIAEDSTQNPNHEIQALLRSQKIGVGVPFPEEELLVLFFSTTSINWDRYCEIIQQFIAMLEPSECYSWFQLDSATSHTSQATMHILKEFFGERLISQGLWPLKLPDMSPQDYFLWGYVKDKVLTKKPNTNDELKVAITDLINGILRKILKNMFRNSQHRVKTCNAGLKLVWKIKVVILNTFCNIQKLFFWFFALLFLVVGCIVHGSPCIIDSIDGFSKKS